MICWRIYALERQALAKGEVPKHDPVASELASLRRAQREWGMSLDALAQRYRHEPGDGSISRNLEIRSPDRGKVVGWRGTPTPASGGLA